MHRSSRAGGRPRFIRKRVYFPILVERVTRIAMLAPGRNTRLKEKRMRPELAIRLLLRKVHPRPRQRTVT